MEPELKQAKKDFDFSFEGNGLDRIYDLFKELGAFYKVYSPVRKADTYVISHPDYIKQVLQTNNRKYVKGIGINRVQILLGKGIMVSEGDFWRSQRRMIQPSFHKEVIHGLAPLMQKSNQLLIDRWAEKVSTGSFDIMDDMSEVTLQIVLKAVFGEDYNESDPNNPFMMLVKEHSRDLMFAMRFRQLGKLIQLIVDRRREEDKVYFDFLSLLMESTDKDTGEGMTDKQLIDEIFTLIIAGHETTAMSLGWTWYLLAINPEKQEKLAEELSKALPNNKFPDIEDLKNLPYTHLVVDEALRLYPPGWLLTRRTIEEDTFGDTVIPKGQDIFLCPYVVHRHPSFWTKPEDFIPERFEEEAERPKFAYFPFGSGPRQCIGNYFAIIEMVFHLAIMASRFKVKFDTSVAIELEPEINLRSKNGIHLFVEKR